MSTRPTRRPRSRADDRPAAAPTLAPTDPSATPEVPVPPTPSAPGEAPTEPTGEPRSGPSPSTLPGYRGLKAWQRAMDLAELTYRMAGTLPRGEQEALGAELRRTAYGIPGAVAAGSAIHDRAEYVRALIAAQGLLARLETLVALAERLGLVPAGTTTPVLQHTGDVGRLVRGLARVTRGGVEPAFRDLRRPARGREVAPP